VSQVNELQKTRFSVGISQHCQRLAHDIIYTGDGLFVIRFRTFAECHNVEINIKYWNREVAGSPLCIKHLIPEHCRCPRRVDQVLRSLKCPASIRQINDDLKPFPSVNFTTIKSQIKKRFKSYKSQSLCNYAVKNNVIYRKCFGQYTGFSMFIDAILISLTNKIHLDDVEFFANLADWPVIKKTTEKLPIFSWCGSSETMDIVLPTYDLTESTVNMLYRVTLDMLSVQQEQFSWDEKVEKGFFRGRDSRRERLTLIDLARLRPDLLNASITNFFFFTDEKEKYGPRVPHIQFTDFFQFKYQINVDGTVAAYRFPYLLAGNSVTLKQESPYYEHFYHDLKAFEHYIPFNRNPSLDLLKRIQWLKTNDKEAKRILRNARNFARGNLMPANIYCYYIMLLKQFAARIVSPIEVDDMEIVDTKSWKCSCTQ